jgi:transposase
MAMPWKTMDVQDQRVRFVVEGLAGSKPVSQLCAEFGISRPTGYLWLERYRAAGIAGITERSRRPLRSPGKTSDALEEQVAALRQCYPDWGARKLAVLLEHFYQFCRVLNGAEGCRSQMLASTRRF